MKNFPLDPLKSFVRDRTMVLFSGALIIAVVAYAIYVALSLESSDLQVATRYTAFGETHFYRNKWYYLLSFIFFGVLVLASHLALAVKLYGREQRQLAIGLISFTFLLLTIAWVITRSVLQVAFL